MVRISFVIGSAGTGKTTKLATKIKRRIEKNQKYYVLSMTHSSLHNIINIIGNGNNIVDKKYFKTFHSFLQINVNSFGEISYVPGCGCLDDADYIFIDELSLVSKSLLPRLFNNFELRSKCLKVVIYGDCLQLPPIDSENFVTWYNLSEYYKICECTDILSLQHLNSLIITDSQIIENTVKVTLLTNCFRCSKETIELFDSINKNKKIDKKYIISEQTAYRLLATEDYTLLVGKYNNSDGRDMIDYYYYNYVGWCKRVLGIERTVCNNGLIAKVGDKFIIENTTHVDNIHLYANKTITVETIIPNSTSIICSSNNEDIMLRCDINKIGLKNSWNLRPKNIITVHKSQGLTLNNVIIDVESLFNNCPSMLYTAMTRPTGNVLFMNVSNISNKIGNNLFQQQKNVIDKWIKNKLKLNTINGC